MYWCVITIANIRPLLSDDCFQQVNKQILKWQFVCFHFNLSFFMLFFQPHPLLRVALPFLSLSLSRSRKFRASQPHYASYQCKLQCIACEGGGGVLGDRESLAAEQVQIKFHSVTPNFPADASQLKLNISLGNGYLISNLYAQYIADDINSLSIQFICNWYLIESKRTIEGSEKCVEINETVINCSSCYKTKIWMLSPSQ